MTSNDAFQNWAESYGEVVQRLDAPQRAERDKKRALARRNLQRARVALNGGDPDQALVNAETAMVNAADAVIGRSGYRVRGKTGSHEARFAFPGLPDAFRHEAKLLKVARRARNTAQYEEVGSIAASFAADAIRAAERLIAAVDGA